MEEGARHKLRNDRSDLDLHIPFLSGNARVYRHVLHRELNLNGQTSELYHLAQADSDRNRPDVFGRRSPVCQDVTRVTNTPAVTKEKRSDRLQVHLVRVRPTLLAPNGPPLL